MRSEADRKKLEEIVGKWFEGATLTFTRGLWQGASEDSSVVEILVNGSHMKDMGHVMKVQDQLMGLAESLKHELEQQAILITSQKIESPEGYGVDSPSWTLEDKVRNWVNDRHSAWVMWCMRNHMNTHLRLPWFIRSWLMDITD